MSNDGMRGWYSVGRSKEDFCARNRPCDSHYTHYWQHLTIRTTNSILSRMKTLALLTALSLCLTAAATAASVLDIKVKDIDGKDTSLNAFKGKVMLIVNVASKCGYTKQYSALEAIHLKYQDKGFAVLGFPCNQFGGQEPGTNEEIKQFCTSKFNVTFPMFDKIEVNGSNRHPLYAALTGTSSPFPGDIKWNFTKFLVGKDGKILKRFASNVTPESQELTGAIEAALSTK